MTQIDERNTISEYDEIRNGVQQRMTGFKNTLKGDAVLAAKVIVDVATLNEGDAGKRLPLYLPLGETAVQAIKKKTDLILRTAEIWREACKGL